MIEHIFALQGGLLAHEQDVFDLGLADEFGEDGRAQRNIHGGRHATRDGAVGRRAGVIHDTASWGNPSGKQEEAFVERE